MNLTLATTLVASTFGATIVAQPATNVTGVSTASAKTTSYYASEHPVKAYKTASKKSKVIGSYASNQIVKVVKEKNTKWVQVSYKGKKAFVLKSQISTKPIIISSATIKTSKNANLNVRQTPSTKGKIIGQFKNKETIGVTGIKKGQWIQTYYKNKLGYVSEKYVTGFHEGH